MGRLVGGLVSLSLVGAEVVGYFEGPAVGELVGLLEVGVTVGCPEGCTVGRLDGCRVGTQDG